MDNIAPTQDYVQEAVKNYTEEVIHKLVAQFSQEISEQRYFDASMSFSELEYSIGRLYEINPESATRIDRANLLSGLIGPHYVASRSSDPNAQNLRSSIEDYYLNKIRTDDFLESVKAEDFTRAEELLAQMCIGNMGLHRKSNSCDVMLSLVNDYLFLAYLHLERSPNYSNPSSMNFLKKLKEMGVHLINGRFRYPYKDIPNRVVKVVGLTPGMNYLNCSVEGEDYNITAFTEVFIQKLYSGEIRLAKFAAIEN